MGSGKSLGAGIGGDWRNDVFGTTELADNAQKAAMEQQGMANKYRAELVGTADDAASKANLMAQSPQQLQALQTHLDMASKQAASDQRLMDAIDPAIMEASKQALNVLQGGGPANNPLMQQSNMQRQQLVNSLREQYGPGAETSAIGQNALRQFDMQANVQNQQSLSQLFGMATTRVNGAGMGNLMQSAQGFGQYGMNGANTQMNGAQLRLQAMGLGNSMTMQTAGAQYTAENIKKRQQQQFWSNWSDSSMAFGESMSGAMGGSGGKGGNGINSKDPNANKYGDGGNKMQSTSSSGTDLGGDTVSLED